MEYLNLCVHTVHKKRPHQFFKAKKKKTKNFLLRNICIKIELKKNYMTEDMGSLHQYTPLSICRLASWTINF